MSSRIDPRTPPVSRPPRPVRPRALAATLIFLGSIAHAPPAAASQDVLAIRGVNVIPMDSERVLVDQTVLVRDGRIAALGPAGEVGVPDDALTVDGRGRYLIPGLPEMHGHLPGPDAPEQLVEDVLFLYVANGITLVRGMQGHPRQLEIRDAVERGDILGPRLVLAGPAMWGQAGSPEAARERVREQKASGFDLVKMGEGISPEIYEAIVEEARAAGLPVAGHVPDAVGLLPALEAGQATIDHLDNYVEELVPEEARRELAPLWGVAGVAHLADESRIPELVEATREAGTAQVPTMVLWEVFFGERSGAELRAELPEVRYMPRATVEGWVRAVDARREGTADVADGARRVIELRRRTFRALHEGGVPILQGTDSPQLFSVPGFATQREMELWVELGMSPFEVLRTGTWNVADHLNELDEAGTVAVGNRADLVLLEGNPLEDIRNASRRAGVVVGGTWLSGEEIRERLDAIALRHREEDGDGPP